MKQCILAAYAGLFITFATSVLSDRLPQQPAAPSPSAVSVSAGPVSAAPPVEEVEFIRVKHGEEIFFVKPEEYLIGVLAAEMPAEFESEALKAQAVAARSYSLYCSAAAKHPDAELCTDFRCCQAWKSREQMAEDWGDKHDRYYEKIRAAVYNTAGEHLLYAGQPVFAAFHSSSAGSTESCGAIWSELPYLVSVESPETEEHVPNYISYVEISPLDFRDSLLHACPEADFSGEASTWIGQVLPEDSGRVDSMVLGGAVYSGTRLRELFSLRSTAFTLEYTGESFLFTVTGFGHGVGMSQYGANVMASEGSDYRAILAHYYPGTVLVS